MAGYSTPAWSNGASPAISAANLLALGQAVELGQHPYGVSSTAAATAAKTVTIDFSGTLSLYTGLTVRVKFTNGNTASAPTLNVNGTGAKTITAPGRALSALWMAGEVLDFTYDGTNWIVNGAVSSLDAKLITGSYTGDGNYGQGNPTEITFPFVPKLVIVSGVNPSPNDYGLRPYGDYSTWLGSTLWTAGQTVLSIDRYYANCDLTGNTLAWYSTYGAAYQLNSSGVQYNYVALGTV